MGRPARRRQAPRRLDAELRRLERSSALIVVDEVGYIPFDPEAANLHVQRSSSRRYERGSMIVTSNRRFDAWGEIFGDDMAAAAMIDRLVHHAEILSLKGDSYRLRERGTGTAPNTPRHPDRTLRPSPTQLRRLRRLRATRWSTFQILKLAHFSRPVDSMDGRVEVPARIGGHQVLGGGGARRARRHARYSFRFTRPAPGEAGSEPHRRNSCPSPSSP